MAAGNFLPMLPDDQPTVPTAPQNGSRTSPSGAWLAPTVKELQAKLPQYEVLEVLGRGGMGAVYKARQKSLKRLVAIKILPLGMADDEFKFVERFQNEAQTMAQMNHPAIVSVYDFGETSDGLLYFVMEFVDGTDVQKMIQASGRLSGEYALAITAHVCDALSYAHKRGVIHRDIKPANILIDQEGHIKVADFGLAKMNDPAQTSGLTRTGTAMGTPDYVAPEVLITGMVADHRVDIYAVGVMLYQMLTGEVPRGMFKLPSLKGIDADARFDAIICKAMEQDREERYQSAMEVRRDLDVILTTPQPKNDGTGVVPAKEIPQKPVAKQPRPPGERSQPPAQQAQAQKAAATPKAKAPSKKQSPATMWLSIGGIVAVVGVAGFLVLGGKPKPQASATTDTALATAPAAKPLPTIKVRENPKPKAAATSASAQGKEIDLLALVDVKRDVVAGEWERTADGLVKKGVNTTNQGAPRLQLPYQPPEEYDFEIEFTPTAGTQSLGQVIVTQSCMFSWIINGGRTGEPMSGFEMFDGRATSTPSEVSKRMDSELVNGRRYRSRVEVRAGSLRTFLDEKEIVNWSGKLQRLAPDTASRLRDDDHIGIRAVRQTTFHKITVREITGTGKVYAGAVQTTAAVSTRSAGSWTDRLGTMTWAAPWAMKGGTLATTTSLAIQGLGDMTDGAIRIRARVAADATAALLKNPVLQPALRSQLVRPGWRGSYLFQAYMPGRATTLIYMEREDKKVAAEMPPVYLWKEKPLPPELIGKKEIEWECRAVGDELSMWADGKLVASVRDSRLTSGGSKLQAYPGIEITRLETTSGNPVMPGLGSDQNAAPKDGTLETSRIAPSYFREMAAANAQRKIEMLGSKIKELNGVSVRLEPSVKDGKVTGLRLSSNSDGGEAPDLSPVAALTDLATLMIHSLKPVDISWMRDLKLESLNVQTGTFTDISVLATMPLRDLTLRDVPVSDWSALKDKKLEKLDLSLCSNLQDLSFVQGMPLARLDVTRSKVLDFSPIAGLPLIELECDADAKLDASLLRRVPTLKRINKKPVSEFKTTAVFEEDGVVTNWQDVTGTLREKVATKQGYIVDGSGVHRTTGAPIGDTMVAGPSEKDRAVRVRYTGQAQVSLWFKGGRGSAYVLAAENSTMFKRQAQKEGEAVSIIPSVGHPEGFDPAQPHELIVAVKGTVVRAWLDGLYLGEAVDSALGGCSIAIVPMKSSTVQKVEVATLAGIPDPASKADWQPIFNKPADFDGDLRDVEFREGATFIKGRTFRAAADPAIVGIRSTMRYLDGDRTGSLTLRSTEPATYGDEDFGLTAFIAPKGAALVIKMRNRPAGISELGRHDFPISPALKEGEPFTFELRAADQKITAIINGLEVGSVSDAWTGATRRFGITPSNTEMTEFRDVAVSRVSAGR